MDNGNFPSEKNQNLNRPALPPPPVTPQERGRQRAMVIGMVLVVLILLGFIGGAIFYLAQPGTPTEKIRDIFIIFMSLEFLLIGLAMIILIIQLASLINLLQNEIRPILESTSETANTLRGTAMFLSDNLVDPVIKLSSYVAALQKMFGIFNPGKKR